MNQINTHDRKIAEALKSLSSGPVAHTEQSSPRHLRKLILGIGITAVAGLTGLAAMSLPAILEHASQALPEDVAPNIVAPEMPATPSIPQSAVVSRQAAAANAVPVAVQREIAGSGYVVAPQSTAIFAKYGGTLSRVLVDVGDWVEAGEVIAILDDAPTRFRLEQAQAALISANLEVAAHDIDLSHAQAQFDRINALAKRGVKTAQQVDAAMNAIKVAQNAMARGRQKVALAELSVRMARETVDALTLHASMSGRITALNATVGDTVLGPADGQSLMTITNTAALFIDADVAETNIALLRVGQRGEAVLDGFPGHPFSIVLNRIAPEVSAAKGTVTIRLTLHAPLTGIRPNMAARIRIFATPVETH